MSWSVTAQSGDVLLKKGTVIVGALRADDHKIIPPFNVFFAGEQVQTKGGSFSFTAKQELAAPLYIFIGQYTIPKIDNHSTVYRMEVEPESKHRFFSLRQDPQDPKLWLIQEEKLVGYQYQLPKYTIMVAVNPKYLAEWPFDEKPVFDVADKRVILPSISFGKGLTKKELHRASACSMLYPLDTLKHHAKPAGIVSHQSAKKGSVEVIAPEAVT
jgi:hypothetical protein